MTVPGILWVTRDFRLRDNPALLAAIADGPLLPLFFIDRLLMAQGAASRWRLARALVTFDKALKARTDGCGLTILRGEPDELLPVLMQRIGARRLHQTDWPAPSMRALQQRTRKALKGTGELILHPGHLLVAPDTVRTGTGGVYRVYSPFARALRRRGPDSPVPDAPARIRALQGHLRASIRQVSISRRNCSAGARRLSVSRCRSVKKRHWRGLMNFWAVLLITHQSAIDLT